MIIVGAGLSGLIAAHAFPNAHILEAGPPVAGHKALLRFRSDVVARATGIDFKPVTVRKGIFHAGEFHAPSIALANMYSRKVIGRVSDRSIWDIEPVRRWIAPDDFHARLVDNVRNRIDWNSPYEYWSAAKESPVINTAPLPVVLGALEWETPHLKFEREEITVMRTRLPKMEVYQTVYFPDSTDHNMYRASITGDTLICEFVGDDLWGEGPALHDIRRAFGLRLVPHFDEDAWERGSQKHGKIALTGPDEERRALLAALTREHEIFSVGRFATWRNVLLDDVVQDLSVVKRLMRMSNYERSLLTD